MFRVLAISCALLLSIACGGDDDDDGGAKTSCAAGTPCALTLENFCDCCEPSVAETCRQGVAQKCAEGNTVPMTASDCSSTNSDWKLLQNRGEDPCSYVEKKDIEGICSAARGGGTGG